MQIKKIAWVFSVGFTVFMLLQFLSLFNVIGNEYDLLIRWVSAISLILTGVFVGILISEKKIPMTSALTHLALVIVGFLTFPLVIVISAPIINKFPLVTETKALISGILATSYLLLYMGLLTWYRKRKQAPI